MNLVNLLPVLLVLMGSALAFIVQVKTGLAKITTKMDAIIERLDEGNKRFDSLEAKVERIDKDHAALQAEHHLLHTANKEVSCL